MGRALRRAVWPLVRIACNAVTLAGVAGFAFLVGLDSLPWLLESLVARLAPGWRLTVRDADLDPSGRLALHRVAITTAEGAPVVRAKRVVVAFSPWSLHAGHLDAVWIDRPLVIPPAALPALGEGGAGAAWSVGRLVVRRGRVVLPSRHGLPAASFRVAADLRDLGTAPGLGERLHEIVVKGGRVTEAGGAPWVTVRGGRVRASLAGLRERRRVDEVWLESPSIMRAGPLPSLAGGADDGGAAPWTLGRLVVRDGRVALPPSPALPGVSFHLHADLAEVGAGPGIAERPHDVTARRVAVTLPGGVPLAAVDAVRTRFSIAGLLAKRVEEVRLAAPALTVPESVPAAAASRAPGQPAGGGGLPAPGWTLGRLVTYDGLLRLAPAGDLPGARAAFAADLHELGADPARAALPHRILLRDAHLRFPGHPSSVVVDAGSIDFTLAGLLARRQVARIGLDRGLLVLDRGLRERLAGPRGGPGPARGNAWSVAVLDIAAFGIRLADLGSQIPDLTLFVRSRLTDVPLDAAGLAKARAPQRVELSDITLDSPLDPFRPVVHVGSVFVEFTMADLLRRQIAAMTAVSPTIYLGEDLIWYMSATRGEAAAAPQEQPWTVRRLRAELGRIVITFQGVDRVGLPLNFRTDAHDVVLGDLATLRLAAALEVPKQNYRFPGLDLELTAVEGALRFDYPPGEARDNVVNTLRVAEIRWREYRIHDGWLAATFDQRGVNGKLGGSAYKGYVNGGASVPFQPGPSAGWASCTDLDLAPVAAAAAGTYLEMTGLIDVEAAVEMRRERIHQASADLDFKHPGKLRFPALDRLLERLPATASSWQRDLARVAVETFRDYPYTDGTGTLRFEDPRGSFLLGLDGERGTRRFDVHYYGEVPVVVDAAVEGQ